MAQFNRIRIHKLGGAADEFEFAASQLLPAIIRKIPDERVLARHHLREIEAYVFGADAPRPGVAGQMPDFGGVKQRLRGHAPAQEAQPADFFPALNDGRFQTCARRCPRRRVTGAAAAENNHVVIKLFARLENGLTSGIFKFKCFNF